MNLWEAANPDPREILGPKAGVLLGNAGVIAHLTRLSITVIKKIRSGERDLISFDTADRIVISLFGGPGGWELDAEAHRIYREFDLGPLDRSKPCAA